MSEELQNKIKKASNGNWKRELWINNCLNWVVENFDDIEPTIKKMWLDKEFKKNGYPQMPEIKGGQLLKINLKDREEL